MKRQDIEISEDEIYCWDCEENVLEISGNYDGKPIYSMCYHEDTAETKEEVIDMVIDSSLDILEEEETRSGIDLD